MELLKKIFYLSGAAFFTAGTVGISIVVIMMFVARVFNSGFD